mgnify:FL=1
MSKEHKTKKIFRSHNLNSLDMNLLGVIEKDFNGQISDDDYPESINIFGSDNEVIKSIKNLVDNGFLQEENL